MIEFDKHEFYLVEYMELHNREALYRTAFCFNCFTQHDDHLDTGHCLFAPSIFKGLRHRYCLGYLYVYARRSVRCMSHCSEIKL